MKNVVWRQNGSSLTNLHSLSPNIWANCPLKRIAEDPSLGRYFYDDFKDYPLIGTQTTQIAHGRYKVFNSGAGTVVPVSAVNSVEKLGGALRVALDTDNDAGSIAQSYPSFRMSGDKSVDGPLWFEGCYAQNSVVTNFAAWFLGLAETDQFVLATGVPFNGGNAITNTGSMIGFHVKEDGLGVVNTVYSDRATSLTDIADDEAGTLVAYTFKKLGMFYDPGAKDKSRMVRFFADNVELETAISKTTLTGLTNLDANALGLMFAAVADSAGTTYEGYLKWWGCAQLNPGVSIHD
jgi:hypothetical protein